MHMRVVWGCGRQLDPEPLCAGVNGGKGKGLLCTKAKAGATQARLPAGDTLVTLENSLQLVCISNSSVRDSDTPSSLFYTLRLKVFRKSNGLHSTACQSYL